jgi:hypothetical protein
MVNFTKLRALVNRYERLDLKQQQRFFQSLHDIAEIELNIRQAGLTEWFG